MAESAVPRDMGAEFEELYARCRGCTMTSVERMFALYQAVLYTVRAGVPGDYVECGVWKGGSAMLMACALRALGERGRKIRLYDTFAGMSEPTAEDRDKDGRPALDRWKAARRGARSDWDYAPLDEVRRNMASAGWPAEDVVFVEGRVEDTLPGAAPASIALLRLDTDLYESTYHELKHLYPLLSPKGVLIVDDYGHWSGAREAVDRYFEERKEPVLLTRVDYTARLAIKA